MLFSNINLALIMMNNFNQYLTYMKVIFLFLSIVVIFLRQEYLSTLLIGMYMGILVCDITYKLTNDN